MILREAQVAATLDDARRLIDGAIAVLAATQNSDVQLPPLPLRDGHLIAGGELVHPAGTFEVHDAQMPQRHESSAANIRPALANNV